MHQRTGMPVALNAGDFLVGEGYRLFCHESIPATMRAEMVSQVAQAHSELSLGQAREFEFSQSAVTLEMCLETHRLKTSPAFRVAMDIGAIAAGKFNDTWLPDACHQDIDRQCRGLDRHPLDADGRTS